MDILYYVALVILVNLNLGGLFRGSFWGGGGGGGVKLQVWHGSTQAYAVSENISFSTRALLISTKAI